MTEVSTQVELLIDSHEKKSTGTHHLRDPWIKALSMGLSRIQKGHITLILPDGGALIYGTALKDEPSVIIELHDTRAIKRILKNGDIGLGESYMDGDWSCTDVAGLIELALLNEDKLSNVFFGKWIAGIVHFFKHALARNTRSGSRRNIAYHYDLGNEFYEKWLDSSMTYSAALFEVPEEDLEAAQQNKYKKVAEIAQVSKAETVLEIGCGWGGFAQYAAMHHTAKLDGLTLSAEQIAYARQRMKTMDQKNRASFFLRDYRDHIGRYDSIVSIEMFEAVGEKNWDTYFQCIKRNLNPGGRAAVQVITIDENRFDKYRKTADFIQRYIFPGGMLPSKSAFIEAAQKAGMTAEIKLEFGRDYADTLRQWKEKFHKAWPEIEPLGFGEQFKRMWEFYLQYCEAGFRQQSIDVVIFELR
jgi:cyclopropane-fatty-acyl-phospholipid synthase